MNTLIPNANRTPPSQRSAALHLPWLTGLLAGAALYLIPSMAAWGATTVAGSLSGTWTPNGSPYLAVADVSVPSGQTLTIQPGVQVIVAPGSEIAVYGRLLAQGTSQDRIVIRGATPSNYWSRLIVYYSGNASRFEYCDISDATNAIVLRIYDVNATMSTEIVNSRFRNCVGACIYGVSQGQVHGSMSGWWANQPSLNPLIRNCSFAQSAAGCRFYIYGNDSSTGGCCPPGHVYGRGYASPILANNVFTDIDGAAFECIAGVDAGSSSPRFVNNTVVDCGTGIKAVDPFDIRITNNIVASCDVGIRRSGSLSLNLQYNCFHANTANFAGYPPTYGQILFVNDVGTPCDLAFNILQDPQFISSTDRRLAPGSPCVDAGSPALLDSCLPPARGSSVSDLGAYGGGYACDWPLPGDPPTVAVQPGAKTTCAGEPVTFSVGASGTAPLRYQWYFNDNQLIPGATNASFTIDPVQTSHAGNYHVVVSNSSGSVTSTVATLTVGQVCVAIDTYAGLTMSHLEVGRNYSIEWTPDLTQSNLWQQAASFQASAPLQFWMDPQPARQQKRFYRVVPSP